MKPPSSPVPSGDREMARNLIRALERRHPVEIASEFVGRDGTGDPENQKRLRDEGRKQAANLVAGWQAAPAGDRPGAWFSYHVYHKSPDWIGPAVCDALNIPYFLAEVSHAPKQAGGPWDIGYRAAGQAIRRADGIIGFSSLDAACVLPLMDDPARYHRLAPFTDTGPFAEAASNRTRHRALVSRDFEITPETPLLLAVGMMRDGDKLQSYRVLAKALEQIAGVDWTLMIVGDGPARSDVEFAFDGLAPGRVVWVGAVPPEDLAHFYAAADLLVWPSVNEAYGMAMLEAQCTGLPVLAGRTGGVPDVIRDHETGMLCPVGDDAVFADALACLLQDRDRLDGYRRQALALTAAQNDIAIAADRLDDILHREKRNCAA